MRSFADSARMLPAYIRKSSFESIIGMFSIDAIMAPTVGLHRILSLITQMLSFIYFNGFFESCIIFSEFGVSKKLDQYENLYSSVPKCYVQFEGLYLFVHLLEYLTG